MKYFAHYRKDEHGTEIYQTSAEHSRNVAELTSCSLSQIGLSNLGYLVGLLHDMGKFKNKFQRYLLDGVGAKGSVIHTFSGVKYVIERYHVANPRTSYEKMRNLTSELVAYAIGGHHGVFDCLGKNGNGFLYRCDTENKDEYEESLRNFAAECASEAEIESLFEKAADEVKEVYKKVLLLSQKEGKTKEEVTGSFYWNLEYLGKLILSALTDADAYDTMCFMSAKPFMLDNPTENEFWDEKINHIDSYVSALPHDNAVGKMRNEIYQKCKTAGKNLSGLNRLALPTGAGKTFSSMIAALESRPSRVILLTPLMAIIEQNSEELEKAMGQDGILKHYSDANVPKDAETRKLNELMTERWTSPIIISTFARGLEILIGEKTSDIRRLNSFIGATLIIDEIQSVPSNMTSLLNMSLNFLSEICGTKVILSSATQPDYGKLLHQLLPTIEICKLTDEQCLVFKRTEQMALKVTLNETPGVILSKITERKARTALVITNTKREAKELFAALRSESNWRVLYISAAMPPAMRIDVMEKFRMYEAQSKEDGIPTIIVSTQVLQAGVNLSVECVFRFAAGVDDHIQSAGRGNRNGEMNKLVPVYVLVINSGEEAEMLKHLPDIQTAKSSFLTAASVLGLQLQGECIDDTMDSLTKTYYRFLYSEDAKNRHSEFPLKDDIAGETTIYRLLSTNSDKMRLKAKDISGKEAGAFMLSSSADIVKKYFSVYGNDTVAVYVPYKEGKSLIADILSERAKYDLAYRYETLKSLQKYAVSLYSSEAMRLHSVGALEVYDDESVICLNERWLDEDIGIADEPKDVALQTM